MWPSGRTIRPAEERDLPLLLDWRNAARAGLPLQYEPPLSPDASPGEVCEAFEFLKQAVRPFVLDGPRGRPIGWFEYDIPAEPGAVVAIQGWAPVTRTAERWFLAYGLWQVTRDAVCEGAAEIVACFRAERRELTEAYAISGYAPTSIASHEGETLLRMILRGDDLAAAPAARLFED